MDLFNAFAEPKSEVKLEYLTDELEDALQVTQIATTPVQSNLEDEQITGLCAVRTSDRTAHTTAAGARSGTSMTKTELGSPISVATDDISDPFTSALHQSQDLPTVTTGTDTVSYTHLTLPTICSV